MDNTVIQFPREPAKEPPRPGAGRPKGSTNKLARELRLRLRDILEDKADDVQGWLESAAKNDPAEAVRLWIGLAQFILPRLSATAIADLTPPTASIPDRIKQTGMSEGDFLSSPRVGALLASGTFRNLEELLDAVKAEQRGEVIEVEAAELDPLLR